MIKFNSITFLLMILLFFYIINCFFIIKIRVEFCLFFYVTVLNKINMNCYTKFWIYGIRCGNCSYTYIGETTNLRLRFNLHKQHIRENANFFVTRHINSCGSGNFYIMPIYKMKNEDEIERKNKESYFIKKYTPNLNRKI